MHQRIETENLRRKDMENKKSNNLTVCIICGILTVIGIVACVISLAKGGTLLSTIRRLVRLVQCILIAYYAFWGYKKPHGNLLKYLILIFVGSSLLTVYYKAQTGDEWMAVVHATIACLSCYIAGGLQKVKKNIVFMSIVTVIIVGYKIVRVMNGEAVIGDITKLVIWIDICAAYFLRYKEHKLAGLIDAPKN